MNINIAFQNAESGISKLAGQDKILALNGPSSCKIRHLLNNLCSEPSTNYLEFGTWRGHTFISAIYGNEQHVKTAIAVDEFKDDEKLVDYANPYTHAGSLGEYFWHVNKNPVYQEFISKYQTLIGNKLKYFAPIKAEFNQAISQLWQMYTWLKEKPTVVCIHIKEYKESDLLYLIAKLMLLNNELTLVVNQWNNSKIRLDFQDIINDVGYTISEYEERLEPGYAMNGWWEGVMACKISQ